MNDCEAGIPRTIGQIVSEFFSSFLMLFCVVGMLGLAAGITLLTGIGLYLSVSQGVCQ